MGGKKGLPSAKEKEEAKAKERNSKAAALKEDAEWEAAGDSHDRLNDLPAASANPAEPSASLMPQGSSLPMHWYQRALQCNRGSEVEKFLLELCKTCTQDVTAKQPRLGHNCSGHHITDLVV